MPEVTKPRLRFKREPNETGLRLVGQSPRGYELWYGDQMVGSANELTAPYKKWQGLGKFYFSVGTYPDLGVVRNNTREEPFDTMEEAKAALRAHVEAGLKSKGLR